MRAHQHVDAPMMILVAKKPRHYPRPGVNVTVAGCSVVAPDDHDRPLLQPCPHRLRVHAPVFAHVVVSTSDLVFLFSRGHTWDEKFFCGGRV